MHEFKVWGPRAQSLAVTIGERSYPLRCIDRGWWTGGVPDAGPNTKYSFVLNQGQPVPDPRSQFQPHGVNGPSQIIDHTKFPWTDRLWQAKPLGSAIIYELHIGTFTPEGTFRAALDRVDYLADLGVTHVELMPVNEFSGDWGWGYDGVDIYAPHHCYGSPDELKTFVNACHEKGVAVLLDVVYNHFGPSGNYLDQFAPYFTSAYQTPWGPAVNFDHSGSFEVRRFFIDNALMWLRDYHFDGLRLDAIHAYYDRSALPFLEELSTEVDSLSSELGRHLVLIAESDLNDPRVVTVRECGGLGIQAQWSDDFHHALHSALTGETNGYYEDFGTLTELAKALQHAFVYAGDFSRHRNRIHGRPVDGLSGHHFLGYAQTHDQVGNRAQGERLCHLLSLGRAKIAAALVLTSPFVPMLFQGEEFASSSPFQYFTNHDPDLGRKVSEGRRNEFKAFGWSPEEVPDPQDPQTFQRSKLCWDELTRQPHSDMHEWYKRLIAFRRLNPSLVNGRMREVEVRCDENAKWMVVKRQCVQLVCNLSPQTQTVPVTYDSESVLASDLNFHLRTGAIEIGPDTVVVLDSQHS
ncbi:MAG: malto-oligosyltrehalose trehalohydrolase [Acidobacteriaceae bacterium]|nr:malto-oligosyltrehalose trehalohydrolase [Acidobacteriaceae bacterium]MBV8571214.1 malto-oligosyltrehalose trehalohydrolase [Acidobacteriaceae bacterium]